MKLTLPQYSGKDYLVLLVLIIPFTVLINATIFGGRYFRDMGVFGMATLVTGLAFCIDFIICGAIAVFFKNRFPNEKELGKKIALMIVSFLIMTAILLTSLFKGYEFVDFLGYRFNENGFVWALVSVSIINIFLALLFEGISRYESWKQNLRETEQLQLAFRQSQLQGLRSQVNPHFLFNSLNSLSSLIADDETAAEKFLDEMSKVYRYMLRNDDDQLVTVKTELSFLHSYIYLLQARYGDGLEVIIEVPASQQEMLLPPLSLQVLVENAITQNSINKKNPLRIQINAVTGNRIVVKNILQPKLVTEGIDIETGLDNLIEKYRLLNQEAVTIEESEKERAITLPLIVNQQQEAT